MRRIILLNCIFSISLVNAGVSVDTVVETPEGSKEIGILKVGDKVICLNKNLLPKAKTVESIEEVETGSIIEITTEDDVVIRVSPNQRMFVPYKWVQVDQLSLGDVLLRKDRTFVRIKAIYHKNESVKLRFIGVEKHQNFLASSNGVLIHNGPYTAYTVYCATKAAIIASIIAGTATAVCVTGGAALSAGAALTAGTGTVTGTVIGVGAGCANAAITGVTIGSGTGIVLGGAGVVIGTEATLGATAIISGATVGIALETTAIAGAAATAAGTAGTVTMTAALAAAVEAAAVSASMPFFACLWCP